MFQNSAYNVQYKKYLGYSDSKRFHAAQEMKPYGSETPVSKLECIRHIQ